MHGDEYDYSKTQCINCYSKVCIICPKHGEFWQSVYSHLSGHGCPKCKCEKMWNSRGRMTTEHFIDAARKIHGNKYDYSKVEYKNAKEKVCIICSEHGEFWQTPYNHLKGHGCRKCFNEMSSKKQKSTIKEFIDKAKAIHGNKYDYSKVNYINNQTKICIICPEHGEFFQTPSSHLAGNGCKMCSKVKENKYTTETFIKALKKIHGNKYDYSKVKYNGCDEYVTVICPKHGEFKIRARHLIGGVGCKKCGIEKRKTKRLSNSDEFIEKARKIHGNKYDYSKVEYINAHTKVCIVCPEHGEFWMTPNDHLSNAYGCRKCCKNISKAENSIAEIIKEYGIKVEQGNRKILNGKEIDIFLPDYDIGIEYDGLKWHSDEYCKDRLYHFKKTNECLNKGIGLIHIFEDEYYMHKEIVLSKIKHLLHINNELEKIDARKCIVNEITNKTASIFFEKNHIQGFSKSTVYLGCFKDKELIGAMSFIKRKEKCWELNRCASDINYQCRGVIGKLLSYFKKHYEWNTIKTFADKKWIINENENLYSKLGFKKCIVLKPDYKYCKGNTKERINKDNFKKKLINKNHDLSSSMSKTEMAKKLGYHKIWDCGLIKYVLEKN